VSLPQLSLRGLGEVWPLFLREDTHQVEGVGGHILVKPQHVLQLGAVSQYFARVDQLLSGDRRLCREAFLDPLLDSEDSVAQLTGKLHVRVIGTGALDLDLHLTHGQTCVSVYLIS